MNYYRDCIQSIWSNCRSSGMRTWVAESSVELVEGGMYLEVRTPELCTVRPIN